MDPEILSIPVYPGQSRVVPPGVESHGSRDTKYPGIPGTVPGSPTRLGVPYGTKYPGILTVLHVERFFPFGCAGLASIFHFLPNSEALGACSLSSKLTIGHDSQSLDIVEALQALLVSVVDPLLLLLLTVERLSVFYFSAHVALCIKNYIIRKFHPKILFQRNQPIIPKEIPK